MDETNPRTRVLLVDDDALVRTGLKLMLGGAPDLTVVGEVSDGGEVVEAVARLVPDVVLMDIRMPVRDGIDATRALRSESSAPPAVIVLTTFDSDANVLASIRAGAAGFLLKHTSPDEIVAAVRRAAVGEPVLSPDVTRTLMAHVAGSVEPDGRGVRARARLGQLSEKEREVAVTVARGLSNAEISEQLFMSVGTVKAHVSSALTKLDLANRIQLAVLAHDAGEA
ncbi:response regulator [Natronosporangium hydrolyticum]|uniref:response regulator n=1 Tax=Natronosporangium hydrolyticum TaxID=2811111 RepID=UPI001EFA203F|nr:response regulator transcription factor [Natronosporangium hydrolyticum]